MAPFTSSIIPLLALVLGSTTAFVTPTGRGASWSLPSVQQSSTSTAVARQAIRRSSPCLSMMATGTSSEVEVAQEKAARLRETAAVFRAQAAELEDKRTQERQAGAERSFNSFDSNQDGAVDVVELKAGLEGPLRRSFVKQLTARMGRKPDREEIDARIAALPGGSLFPDDLARKLIDTYDQNGDGLLQRSEFAPTEELRTRLENMFRDQQETARQARVEERQRQMEDKLAAEVGTGAGAVVPAGGVNDGPATAADKALSALPYLLPLVDGISFAGHLFGAFPEQTAWAQPLAAVLLALRSLPFATLVGFFSLSALSGNPQVNKLVRFNMQQAINLDIALIVPGVLGALASVSLGQDAYKLVPLAEAGSDVVFVAMLAAVAYSVVTSSTGSFPNKLPLLGRLNRENPDREEEEQ
uniref:Chloroplast Tic20-14 protein n=1 Tax=Saccharina japonica TaxID=88149 RepID=A0A5B8ZSX8_SACJA|nr:chloroplast Tic20-14 protein precursor [Saccharina japonica]